MSNSQSYSYSSSSFSSASFSSSSPGQNQSHSQRYTQTSHSDSNRGTTTNRRFEETGKPTIEETTSVPANAGRRVEGAGLGSQGRIEDVSETERDEESEEARRERIDREYEERMEDEYAKREGYVFDFLDDGLLRRDLFGYLWGRRMGRER